MIPVKMVIFWNICFHIIELHLIVDLDEFIKYKEKVEPK